MRKNTPIAGLMALVAFAPAALAQFAALDDFQALNLGNINGQNGWTASANSGTVVTDPGNAANKLLSVTTTSANIYKPLAASLPNDAVGTLYYQMKRLDLVNVSTGLSDLSAPTAFGDYESQLNVNSATANPQPIRMRDVSAFDAVQTSFASAAAYHVWHVINNSDDTTRLYIQSATDGSPVLQLSGGQSDFVFRNGAATNPLLTFLIKTGNSNPPTNSDAAHAGPFYIDNVYFDPSGSNLSAPAPLFSSIVPEPASLTLSGMAGFALLMRRRRA